MDSIIEFCDGSDSSFIEVVASGVNPFEYRYRIDGSTTFNPYQDSASFLLPVPNTYEFQIRDDCGNTSPIFKSGVCFPPCDSLTITFQDSLFLTCQDDTSAMALGSATINFSCCPGPITINYTDSISNYTCSNSYSINRIWRAEDDCGNSASGIQIIEIIDTLPPVFAGVLPSDTIVNCSDIFNPDTLIAADECGYMASVLLQQDTISGSCPNIFTLRRIWTAIDSCDNSITHTQLITVQDTTAPIFDVTPPKDTVVVECYQNIPTPATITATDNCGTAHVFVDENRIDGSCFGQFTIERRWVALDDCNNETISDAQYIIVLDTVGPLFNETLPVDFTLNCTDSIPAPDTLTTIDCSNGNLKNIPNLTNDYYLDMGKIIPSYHSNSNGFGVIFDSVSIGSILQNGTPQAIIDYYDTIYVKLTVDSLPALGNQFVKRQNLGFSVQNGNVQIDFSQPITFQVSGNPRMDPTEKVTFSGDGNLFYPFPITNGIDYGEDWVEPGIITSLTNPYIIHNFSETVYNRAGQVYGGTGTVLNFEQESEQAVVAQLFVSVFDPKSNSTANVVYSDTVIEGVCASSFEIHRKWVATDSCGNTTEHIQTVTVQDTVAPTFNEILPLDTLVNCDATPAALILTGNDNCSTASVTFTEDTLQGSCANNFTLTRTWVATDACGNTTEHIQAVTVQDTVAPTFNEILPLDTLVNCDATPAALILTANDNCSTASVTFTEDTLQGSCANNFILTRTWVATDACGNTTEHIQAVTVQDTVAPIFSSFPSDIIIENDIDECSALVSWIEPTVTNNCGSISINSSHLNGSSFPVGTTEVWYFATDECNNQDSISFLVIVEDNQNPNLSIDINPSFCEGEVINWTEMISDNCQIDTIISSHQSTDSFAIGTTTVTYSVIDIHGNDSTYSFDVVIHPIPEISLVETNVVVCLTNNAILEVEDANLNYSYNWEY